MEEGEKFYMSKETRKFAVKQYALKMAALTRPEKKIEVKFTLRSFSPDTEKGCAITLICQ